MDPRALREALREAVAAQLVVADEEGFYAFRHALLREVVVDDLLPGERAELHLALARALETRAEGLPDHGGAHLAAGIAHHYLESGDQPAALAASVRAAEAAEAVHAHGEAAALFSRALQLWDRVADAEELAGRDHVELLRAAAWSTSREHEPARAETLLRAALTEVGDGDPVRPPACWSSLAREQFTAGRSAQAAETRREALELLPDEPSATRATLLAGLTKDLMMESRYREVVEAARGGARGGARRRRRDRGDPRARRDGRRDVRPGALRRGRAGAARGAAPRGAGRHAAPAAVAPQPRRVAGGGRAARGGARDRRRGRRAVDASSARRGAGSS